VKPALGGKDASKTALVPQRSRGATLYFVRIDDDGVIVRQEVKRQIPASDQPLTDALAALIGGPSEDELRHHLLSLIPQGTKLLSAQVRGSTAYLNFNEAFMYNHYGIEGYAGQLKQIVYTATAFPSVQDVQILIEGERHDYLGGEGVYIGRPLSRNSF
jgi:spore germination protein GerM